MDEKKNQDVFDKFVNSLLDGIFRCMEKGESCKMTCGTKENPVTIEIYKDKNDIAKLNQMIEDVVKSGKLKVEMEGTPK